MGGKRLYSRILAVAVFVCWLLVVTTALPQRFSFSRRSPFSFRTARRPFVNRRSFRDFSDEDFDDFGSFQQFSPFRRSNNFGNSRGFSGFGFRSPFAIRRNRFFGDDDSFEDDD